MLRELEDAISNQLVKLPDSHPNRRSLIRGFLKIKGIRRSRELQEPSGEVSKLGIEDARKRIQEIVSVTNKIHGIPSSSNLKLHERIKQAEFNKYGEKSVLELLPTNYFHYTRIANILRDAKIFTDQNLMIKRKDSLLAINGVNYVRFEILSAMQNLAAAKFKDQF